MNSTTIPILKKFFPVVAVIIAVIAFSIYYKDDLDKSQIDYNGSIEEDRSYAIFTSDDNIEIKFELDIADTSFLRARGLMYRENYPSNRAMHFIYPTQSADKFWMKNTLINLDIIFLDSNNLISYISADTPPCKTDVCPVYGPNFEYSSVIEINGGLTEKYGINIGDQVKFID
jgi:uncharacterized membrane protein (UPF0127 family)